MRIYIYIVHLVPLFWQLYYRSQHLSLLFFPSSSESSLQSGWEQESSAEESGGEGNDDDGADGGGENDGEPESVPGLGEQILVKWKERKFMLDHDYAITAWILCVMPEVRESVKNTMTGTHRLAVEQVIERLHAPPCLNPSKEVGNINISDIIYTFWGKFKDFSNQTGDFSKPGRWLTSDVRAAKSHLWHEKYSLPYTNVLGFVACRTTSKNLGIGAAERSWGDVKEIKSGKRSHLGTKLVEMRAILYTAARVGKARMKRVEMEKIDAAHGCARFGDDDIK